MKRALRILISIVCVLIIALSIVACDKKDEETEKAKKSESSELSPEQCQSELQDILEKTQSQKTALVEESGFVSAYYFDGSNTFLYFKEEGISNWYETWIGNIGDQYYVFENSYDYDTNNLMDTEYTIISKSELDGILQFVIEDDFYALGNVIEKIEGADKAECKKTTKSNKVEYQIEVTYSDESFNITVTAVDGLVTKIHFKDEDRIVTYDYTTVITMPDINNYIH